MTTHDHAAPEFWIDVGGTFTDCFVRFADGRDQGKLRRWIERHSDCRRTA
jgi:N-methylhydantoinase A/oxoprolinase/acetone carboxylase beta subunit